MRKEPVKRNNKDACKHVFKVLVFNNAEDDSSPWVAQILEIDIAAQANSLEALKREVERLLFVHCEACKEMGIPPFEGRRSPQHFWDTWEKCAWEVKAEKSEPAPRYRLPAPPDIRIFAGLPAN